MASAPFLFLTFLTLFCLSLLTPTTALSTVSITTISNNRTLICALTKSSRSVLNCTTFPKTRFQFSIAPHNYSYSSVVGGNGFLCGLISFHSRSTSVMGCWRFGGSGTGLYYGYKRIYKGPILEELDSGNDHVCGIVNGTKQLNCWQWKEFNSTSSLDSSNIAVGDDFVCGLNGFGNINCAGNYNNVVGSGDIIGNYSVISAGLGRFCAISFNGSLNCWGETPGEEIPGRGEVFTSIALGDNRSCAVRDNGTVVCWGTGNGNNFSMPSNLEQTYFATIVAKGKVFCGVVSANYSLVCWGNEILDSSPLVFNSVMPGVCKTSSQCPFGPLPGSGSLCGQGQSVCQDGVRQSTTSEERVPSSAPPSSPVGSGGGWSAKMVVFLVVGCIGLISLGGAAAFFLVTRGSRGGSSRVHDSGNLDNETEDPQEDGGRSRSMHEEMRFQPQRAPLPVLEKKLSHTISSGLGHLEEFSFQVLLGVTNNFSEDHRVGNGSFGSVYHAVFEDGREVAIKRAELSKLPRRGRDTNRNHRQDKDTAFVAELAFLSRLNHKNLVKLLGFCEDNNERMLVYEYVSNGTLHDHLHKLKDRSVLKSWPSRLKVALDAARGIEYIHSYADPPVIHRDIKSSNILLDSNWMAKVSDFGLSLLGPEDEESHLSLIAAGTVGYMDPEYYRLHQLTTKSDVYSFGVVLLELLTGYTAIHLNEDGMPRNVVEFVVPYIYRGDIHRILDPSLPPPTPIEIEVVTDIGHLASECVTSQGRDRPSMTDIVGCLERAWKACLVSPALCWSSTGSST